MFDINGKGILEPMSTKVLLTGFEPFGGHQLNPSAQAVSDAAAALNKTGIATVAVELPCVFGQADRRLRREIALHRPELVICVGQASGRARIGLERVAVNIDDAPIADNAGEQPVDLPIAEDGPAAYFSTLPVKACLRELTARQIPAEVSQSVGTYVCNHVFYSLMHELAGGAFAGTRGGFVHIPCAPGQAPEGGTPAMEVATAAAAVEVVARCSLHSDGDLNAAAGALH
jgi:pyroglutamyl-peptidase